MKIMVRPAVPEDCQRIRPLQEEIARLHYEGRPDLFKNEARFFTEEAFGQRLADPKHTVFVAEAEDGTVAGYAFAWVVSFKDHAAYVDFDGFYIDDICVLETCRRQGVGTLLFEACKEKAKAQGCRFLDLGVWSFNKAAIAFYERQGMTERTRRMECFLV